MHVRTRATREHVRSQWGEILDDGELMAEWASSATPQQLRAMQGPVSRSSKRDTMTLDDVRRIAEQTAQSAVSAFVRTEAQIYCKMNMAFVRTEDPVGFITSDHPCIRFDPELRNAPALFRSPGLASPTIQVTLPLSPSRLLFLNWTRPIRLQEGPALGGSEANRMLSFSADKQFVVRRHVTDDCWFAANPLQRS